MSNDKQTAVEWLIEIDKYRNITIEEWQQAKEMEKEQIINAANSENSVDINYGEDYYEQKYGGNK